MANDQDAQPGMKTFPFLDAMPSVLRAALDLMVSKGRTYGDSWKARGGRGAWYTLVRPMDRLQLMVERDHAGDIFAGVRAAPEGGDGTVLDALRDLRNYLSLVEAEMVAEGVVQLPVSIDLPEAVVKRDAAMIGLIPEIIEIVRRHQMYEGSDHPVCHSIIDDIQRLVRVPDEVVERATDAARDRASALEDAGDVTQDAETRAGKLGAGAIADGCYTTLDLGQSKTLWHVGVSALPSNRDMGLPKSTIDRLESTAHALMQAHALVASRELEGGDLQIIIRIPRD